MAAAGEHGRAETITRSLTTPDRQAQALTGLAATNAAAGDHERARRLLISALAVASWQVAIPVLAEHWPQVVLRRVKELSGKDLSSRCEA